MALRFIDSFQHYDSNHIFQKWTQTAFCNISASGRNGQCLAITAGGAASITLTPVNNWTIGFAMKFHAGFGEATILSANAIGTNRLGVNLMSLVLNGDGTFGFVFGTTNYGTSIFSIVADTWYYIEVHMEFSGDLISTVAELRVNGTVRLNASGSVGVHGSDLLYDDSVANFFNFQASGGSGVTFLDDVYIVDGTGASHKTYLGDVKLLSIYPRADVRTDFGVSSGSTGDGNNFRLVNEHDPDDDVSFIFDDTIGHADDFFFDLVPTSVGDILAVQYSMYARKDDEGTRVIQPRVDGTVQGDKDFISDTYVYYRVPLDTKNGTPWSVAEVNSSTFGVQIVDNT